MIDEQLVTCIILSSFLVLVESTGLARIVVNDSGPDDLDRSTPQPSWAYCTISGDIEVRVRKEEGLPPVGP